jgi:hypothetical protein
VFNLHLRHGAFAVNTTKHIPFSSSRNKPPNLVLVLVLTSSLCLSSTPAKLLRTKTALCDASASASRVSSASVLAGTSPGLTHFRQIRFHGLPLVSGFRPDETKDADTSNSFLCLIAAARARSLKASARRRTRKYAVGRSKPRHRGSRKQSGSVGMDPEALSCPTFRAC